MIAMVLVSLTSALGQEVEVTMAQVAKVVEQVKSGPATEIARTGALSIGQSLLRQKRFAEAQELF